MKYREFFQIEIEHRYFLDGITDLLLIPDKETRKRLKTFKYLIKKTAKGVRVLAPINTENSDVISLDKNEVFIFHLFPTSGSIRELTDTSQVENGDMISFSNKELPANTVQLISSHTVQTGIYNGFSAISNIEILANNVINDNAGRSPIYQAILNTKSIKWKYYFVSSERDTNLSLESRDQQVIFNELVVVEGASDRITNALQLNFPDREIKIFESNDAIPYSSKPIKNIKLLKNGDILINHLSNPKREQQGIQIIKIK